MDTLYSRNFQTHTSYVFFSEKNDFKSLICIFHLIVCVLPLNSYKVCSLMKNTRSVNLRNIQCFPIHTMRFVVTTCSIQMISHYVNAKIAPTLAN